LAPTSSAQSQVQHNLRSPPSFEEGLKGSITEGKLADFVLLGQDPHDVDPSELINIPIAKTVLGGRTMHEG